MMAAHVLCLCSLSVNVVLLVRWGKGGLYWCGQSTLAFSIKIFIIHLLFSVQLVYDIYGRMEAELCSDSPSWWGGFRALFKRLVSRCYRLIKSPVRCWNLFSLEHRRSAKAQIPRTRKVRGSVVRVLKSPKTKFVCCVYMTFYWGEKRYMCRFGKEVIFVEMCWK